MPNIMVYPLCHAYEHYRHYSCDLHEKKKKYCDCDNDTIIMLTNNSINNFHDDDNSINNEKKQTNELINKQ